MRQVAFWVGVTLLFSVACGGMTSHRDSDGHVTGSLVHGGRTRSYLLYVPQAYDPATAAPLVIGLHGGGGNGEKAEKLSGFSQQADRGGFLAVYPDAIEKNWNDGRGVNQYLSHREHVDDVGFISALIDAVGKDFSIDRTRVYVTGMSNGAIMAHRLACEAAQKFAAIAPVAGAMAANTAATCSPSKPISALVINGTADSLVPWDGGYVRWFGRKTFGAIRSVPETVGFWVAHNGCSPKPEINLEPDADPEDGTRVLKREYGHCRGGVSVILYEVQGGGHTWPMGTKYLPAILIGKTSQDINASEVIWNFFRTHSR